MILWLSIITAIEIFQNIVLYLRTDVIPVQLVIATALMAIARKVIILDYSEVPWVKTSKKIMIIANKAHKLVRILTTK